MQQAREIEERQVLVDKAGYQQQNHMHMGPPPNQMYMGAQQPGNMYQGPRYDPA